MAKKLIGVSSSAFKPGDRIPQRHACHDEGKNVSPPLSWSGVPAGTRELALICDDPDAPSSKPWVHWILFKIPATATGLPEGIAEQRDVKHPSGAQQGLNSWGKVGWGGPLPPEGHGTHHYHFKLYALDAPVTLAPGAGKEELLRAMTGHVLAEGELIGTYRR
jgi:Raf kinase inhibitor-like YbhB/YbcL family protein